MNSNTVHTDIDCINFMHSYSVLSASLSTEIHTDLLSESVISEESNFGKKFKTMFFKLSSDDVYIETNANVSENLESCRCISTLLCPIESKKTEGLNQRDENGFDLGACKTVNCIEENCEGISQRESVYFKKESCNESPEKENYVANVNECTLELDCVIEADVRIERECIPSEISPENSTKEINIADYMHDIENTELSDIESSEHQNSFNTKFTCDVCFKAFQKKSNLKRHYRIHSGDNPHACEDCPSEFPTLSRLNEHKHVHSWKRPFVCRVCSKSFARMSNLTRHYHTHEGKKEFQCEVCLARFCEMARLQEHCLDHAVDRKFKCNVCDKKFLKKYNLNRHFRVHVGKVPHKCKACGECFSKKINLLLHRLAHAKKKEITFQKVIREQHRSLCKQDSVIEEEGTNFNAFVSDDDEETDSADEPEDKSSATFDTCDRQYFSKSNQEHPSPPNLEESQCAMSSGILNDASQLEECLVMPSDGRAVQDNVSGAIFDQDSRLEDHLVMSDDKRPIQCNMSSAVSDHANIHKDHFIMQRQYDQFQDLQEHYVINHGVKPLECNTCGKSFLTRIQLESHSLMHVPIEKILMADSSDQGGEEFDKFHGQLDDQLPVKKEPESRLAWLIQTLEARLGEPKVIPESIPVVAPQNQSAVTNSYSEPPRLAKLIQALETRLKKPKSVFLSQKKQLHKNESSEM